MKASEIFAKPKIEGNVVFLEALGNNDFKLAGTSIPANVEPGSRYLTSCYLNFPDNLRDEAIIAVIAGVNNYKGNTMSVVYGFYRLGRNLKKEIFIVFEQPVIFSEGILPSIHWEKEVVFINIKTPEGEFTSCPKQDENKGKFFVPDSNDLCRFLAGDITLEELKEIAEEVVAEESARAQLADLQAKLNGCQAYISQVEGELKKARDTGSSDVFELTNMLTKAFSEAEKNRNIFKEIAGKATEIEVAASSFWVTKGYIKKLAQEILELTAP